MLRIALLFCLFTAKFGFSTIYEPHTWDDIIENTEYTLKVKVLNTNSYVAKVEVLQSYKTNFNQKYIWVNSARLRPGMETIGKSYLLFISDSIKQIETSYWEKEDYDNWKQLDTLEILQAIKNGQAYYSFGHVGCYPIKNDKIFIDLTNPYVRDINKGKSYAEFENFLQIIYHPEKKTADFHAHIINQLNQNQSTASIIHYLKMLSLSDNKKWFPTFKKLATLDNNELHLAIIENIVIIENDSSKNLLRHYWNQNDPFYSEKIIMGLVAAHNTQFAPYILHTLNGIISVSEDLSTAEKPVNYEQIRGILYYFKSIPNKEAVPALQKLLVCKNINIIDRTIIALELNQDSSYVDVILEQIENESMSNQLICTYALSASKFELEKLYEPLVKKCFANKADPFSAITADVLLHLNQKFAEPQFIAHLDRTITDHSHLQPHRYGQVFQKYVGLCYKYEISNIKELVYNAYSEYTGYGYQFRENPNLFIRQNQLHDSLNSLFKKQLKPLNYRHFKTHVRLHSNNEFDCYVSLVYPNFSKNENEDTIRVRSMLRRELCASYLNMPIANIETKTANDRNAYYDSEFYNAVKKSQSRVINSFYSYLIDFGDEKDLAFLENLRKSEQKNFGSTAHWTINEAEEALRHELKAK